MSCAIMTGSNLPMSISMIRAQRRHHSRATRPGGSRRISPSCRCCCVSDAHALAALEFLLQSVEFEHCCQRLHLMARGDVKQPDNLALLLPRHAYAPAL